MTVTEWTSLGDDVARAVGVVVAQADCSPAEALARLLAAAEAAGSSVEATAVAAIERRLRFDRASAGSVLRTRVSVQCVEIGARDAALNATGEWATDARR
jgi:hypothetical protein